MSKYLWLAVTADELELPIAVADTAEELGKMFDVTDTTVYNAVSKGFGGRINGWKYLKVENE